MRWTVTGLSPFSRFSLSLNTMSQIANQQCSSNNTNFSQNVIFTGTQNSFKPRFKEKLNSVSSIYLMFFELKMQKYLQKVKMYRVEKMTRVYNQSQKHNALPYCNWNFYFNSKNLSDCSFFPLLIIFFTIDLIR